MSCLFASLASNHYDFSAKEMKHKIYEYLSTDPLFDSGFKLSEMLSWSGEFSLEGYLNIYLQDNFEGSSIEIIAYTKIFQKNVNVKMPKTVLNFPYDDKFETINLVYENSHYESEHMKS